MKYKNEFITILVLILFSLIFYILNIRVCLFYNITSLPCPSCGLTRAFIELFKLNFIKSFNYNILPIPIIIFLILLFTNKKFVYKNKYLFIILSIILLIISFIKNINNPLLY